MGLDYVGEKASFHMNWSRHAFVRSLLTQLGADLVEWSESNNGHEVSPRTCKAWARVLKGNINGFRVVRIPDGHHVGGYAKAPLVHGIPLEKELSANGTTGHLMILMDIIERGFGSRYTFDPHKIEVRRALTQEKKWILEFADFLESCGGCEQR